MFLDKLIVGPLEVNCYILGDEETKEAAVIDPGDEDDRILDLLNEKGLKLRYIINTHAHFDHVGVNQSLKEATGAEIMIHEGDKDLLRVAGEQAFLYGLDVPPSEPDRFLRDDDEICIGEIKLRVLNTPGHSDGCICLLGNGFVFTGDTIFAGSAGRTDFPGGNMGKLLKSIRERLATLDDNIKVYPGHGPETTIGFEKRNNPFFSTGSFGQEGAVESL